MIIKKETDRLYSLSEDFEKKYLLQLDKKEKAEKEILKLKDLLEKDIEKTSIINDAKKEDYRSGHNEIIIKGRNLAVSPMVLRRRSGRIITFAYKKALNGYIKGDKVKIKGHDGLFEIIDYQDGSYEVKSISKENIYYIKNIKKSDIL